MPELAEGFLTSGPALFKDRHHGVLLAAVLFAQQLCKVAPEAVEAYRREVPQLDRILKALVGGGSSPEHEVNGIVDPFLQARYRVSRIAARPRCPLLRRAA